MQSFSMVKQMESMELLGFKGLKFLKCQEGKGRL
jgi:hypothetical protein